MNDTTYNNLRLKLYRKTPQSYRGVVDSSGLDYARSKDNMQRELAYGRLGETKKVNDANIDFEQQRIGLAQDRHDLASGIYDTNKRNLGIGNVLSAVNIPISYLQGANQARQNQALTNLLKNQAEYYRSLMVK